MCAFYLKFYINASQSLVYTKIELSAINHFKYKSSWLKVLKMGIFMVLFTCVDITSKALKRQLKVLTEQDEVHLLLASANFFV